LLKSAFAWFCRGTYYISPYLGDLENYVTQQHFEHTLEHFQQLLLARPDKILVDRHPEYFSTELGRRLAEEWEIPVQSVQHHQAHFAAVLGENNLWNTPDPILGVIWDGTGYGDDGQSWGGEFFVFADQKMSRPAHLAYFPQLLGDKMAREPRLSALSLLANHPAQAQLETLFSPNEWALYQKILQRYTGGYTSSMGRLFDGVAALLGLATKVTYEGEAALLLEDAARRFFQTAGLDFAYGYVCTWGDGVELVYTSLLDQLLTDRMAGVATEKIAAKFHLALVHLVQQMADRTGCRKLAFSGGVFQNALLVDLLTRHLAPHLELFFHQQLSPNDENIAYGQLMYAQIVVETRHALSLYHIPG
jgi:hydrogenase maturation protein HypF